MSVVALSPDEVERLVVLSLVVVDDLNGLGVASIDREGAPVVVARVATLDGRSLAVRRLPADVEVDDTIGGVVADRRQRRAVAARRVHRPGNRDRLIFENRACDIVGRCVAIDDPEGCRDPLSRPAYRSLGSVLSGSCRGLRGGLGNLGKASGNAHPSADRSEEGSTAHKFGDGERQDKAGCESNQC